MSRKEYMAAWRAKTRDERLARNRAARRDIKSRVINRYGGCCELCSIADPDVLTIDHIWGGGKEHRKEVPPSAINQWLIDNNFPPGFRLLCFNCNFKSHWIAQQHGSPPMSMGTLQREIKAWADAQFPGRTLEGLYNKLKDEIREFIDTPTPDELADVFILILDWAEMNGWNMQQAINRKMNINLNRQWILDPSRGVWQHVR